MKFMKATYKKFLLVAALFLAKTVAVNAQSVQYSDTASMLSGYARNGHVLKYTDTADMLNNLLRKVDTAGMLTNYLRKSDTAAMLSGYQRKGTGLLLSGGTLTGALAGTTASFSGDLQVTGNATVSGNITGASIIKSGGTPSQFLKADGSVDSKAYIAATDTASMLSGYLRQNNIPAYNGVPYTGANAGLNMGNNFIQVGPAKWFATSGLAGNDLSIGIETNRTIATYGSYLNITAQLYPGISFWRSGGTPAGSISSTPSGRGNVATFAVTGDFSASEGNMHDLGGVTAGAYRWRNVYAVGGNYSGAVTSGSFVKTGGTSSQFLKADGSVDNNVYLTTSDTSAHGYTGVPGVPYTGASGSLNMGNNSIQVGPAKWFATSGLAGNDLSIGTEANRTIATYGSYLNITAQLYPGISFWRTGGSPAGSISSTPSGRGNVATLAVTGDFSASEGNMHDLGGITAGAYRWRNVYAVGGNYSGAVTSGSFVKTGGTSSQFLKADGSVDNNVYLTASDTSAYGYTGVPGVPYTGASASLNMGNNSIQVGPAKWFATPGLGGNDLSIGTEANRTIATYGSYLNITAQLYPGISFWRNGGSPAGSISSTPSGRGNVATFAVTGDFSASEGNMHDLGGITAGAYRWRNVYAVGGNYSGSVLAGSFSKVGGTSTQFLKADGSVDNKAYVSSADTAAMLAGYARIGSGSSALKSDTLVLSRNVGFGDQKIAIYPDTLNDGVSTAPILKINPIYGVDKWSLGVDAQGLVFPDRTSGLSTLLMGNAGIENGNIIKLPVTSGTLISSADTASMLSGYVRLSNLPLAGSGVFTQTGNLVTPVTNGANISTTGSVTASGLNASAITHSGFLERKAIASSAGRPALSPLGSISYVDSAGARITYSNAPLSQDVITGALPVITLYRFNGSIDNKMPIQKNMAVGAIRFNGEWSGSATNYNAATALISASATDDYTSTTRGTRLNFTTTAQGSFAPAARYSMDEFSIFPVIADNLYSIGKSSLRFSKGYFADTVFGSKFVQSGGTSSQFLKADGSVDNNVYLTASSLPAGTGVFTQTGNLVTPVTEGANISTTGAVTASALNASSITNSGFFERKAVTSTAGRPVLSPLSSGFYVDSAGARVTYSNLPLSQDVITGVAPFITLYKFNGNIDNKTPVLKNAAIGGLRFSGESPGTTNNYNSATAVVSAVATEDYSATARGTRLNFTTTAQGSFTASIRYGMDEFSFFPVSLDNIYSIGKSSLRFSKGYFADTVFGSKFVQPGGTSSQFLKADGSIDNNTYLTASTMPPLNYLPLTGGTVTGAITTETLSTTQTGLNVAVSTTVLSKLVDRYERVEAPLLSEIAPSPNGGPMQVYFDSNNRLINLAPQGGVSGRTSYVNGVNQELGYRYGGSWDAKTPLAAGFAASQVGGGGWDGSNWAISSAISFNVGASGPLSPTNHGGRINFLLTSPNSITTPIKIVFDENGAILKGTQTSPANSNIKDYTTGSVFATDTSFAKAFVKAGGTSSQFLKADGSVDNNSYLTTGSAASNYLPLAGGTLTGTLDGLDANFKGTVRVKKITVTPTGWADYVFAHDYKLRPLEQVASYIETNKHLPDMPSAKEVEEKGISLGDNQALLLRKIEELTLYVIDLKKEINELKKDKKTKTRTGNK
jgi:hypothetical protein